MARTLNVYYDRELVGQLIQDDSGQMIFQYDESWLGRPEPIALSRSLPLREEPFNQNECLGFFGGTLPEEGNRNVIARIFGISDKNDFAMLEQIGGEAKSALIHPGNFDRFAAAAGLGAGQARARIPALADRLLEEIPGIDKPTPVSEAVAVLITERCEDYRSRFSRK